MSLFIIITRCVYIWNGFRILLQRVGSYTFYNSKNQDNDKILVVSPIDEQIGRLIEYEDNDKEEDNDNNMIISRPSTSKRTILLSLRENLKL